MATKITPAPLTRPLHVVMDEIRADYRAKGKPVHYAAKPYVDALTLSQSSLSGTFGHDSVDTLVITLLGNLGTWRGPVAARVKAELRAALAHHQQGNTGRDAYARTNRSYSRG